MGGFNNTYSIHKAAYYSAKRAALVQQLPPETQDMAAAALEMGAGMEEDEVAELVSGLQASAASPGEGGGGASEGRGRGQTCHARALHPAAAPTTRAAPALPHYQHPEP